MRRVTIGKLVSLSIERTKLILFQPFSWKKWLCLLFIAWLAGALGSGNGNNFSNRGNQTKQKAAVEQSADKAETAELESNYSGASIDSAHPYLESEKSKFQRESTVPVMAIILLVMILLLPIIILFTWLGSRFKFIWFNSIVNNDASISAPFTEYKKEGDSLFKFYLILMAVTFGSLALLALWVFGVGRASGIFAETTKWSFSGIMGAFLVPGILFIVGLIFLMLLGIAIDHFVVTIMAVDRCPLREAWNKFKAIYDDNKKEFAFYVLVIIGLSIVGGIIAFLISLIFLVVVLLAAAIVFGIPYLLLAVMLKITPLFVIFAIIAGIPFLAATILLLVSINLPFAVFFRNFSLYFLTSIEYQYNPLGLEESSLI